MLVEACRRLLVVDSAESSISEGARLRPVTAWLRVDLLLPGQLAAMLSFRGMSGDAESTWRMGRAQPWKMVSTSGLTQLLRLSGQYSNCRCQPAELWHTDGNDFKFIMLSPASVCQL